MVLENGYCNPTLVTWCDLNTWPRGYGSDMSHLRTTQSSHIYLLFPIHSENNMTTARIATFYTGEHIHNILEDIQSFPSDHVACVNDLGQRG